MRTSDMMEYSQGDLVLFDVPNIGGWRWNSDDLGPHVRISVARPVVILSDEDGMAHTPDEQLTRLHWATLWEEEKEGTPLVLDLSSPVRLVHKTHRDLWLGPGTYLISASPLNRDSTRSWAEKLHQRPSRRFSHREQESRLFNNALNDVNQFGILYFVPTTFSVHPKQMEDVPRNDCGLTILESDENGDSYSIESPWARLHVEPSSKCRYLSVVNATEIKHPKQTSFLLPPGIYEVLNSAERAKWVREAISTFDRLRCL